MTSLATVTDADGMVYLPQFGSSIMTYYRAMDEAEALANQNGAPCGIWARDGWYTVCEHAPDSITPDPCASGWALIAVMDPMSAVDAEGI